MMMKEEDFQVISDDFLNVQDSSFDLALNSLLTLPNETPPLHEDETTMDVSCNAEFQWQPPINFIPVAKVGVPDRHVFAGDLDFQVEINGADTNRKKYLYSNKVNRIYVDIKTNFSMQFHWDRARAPRPMYVRSTVVFSDVSQAEKRVERCTQHTHDLANGNLDMSIVKNVLHSARDMATHGVYYCGITQQKDSWYSVIVEFPTPSAGPYSHAYQFVCKNSCSTGINRRAIDIIFELEDAIGTVYGRQTVGARCCSCPKRDMNHDEGNGEVPNKGKKRLQPPTATDTNKTKKIKLETLDDDEVLTLPSIEIIGVRAAIAGLNAMLAVMEYDASLQTDPHTIEKYKTKISALKTKLDHYKTRKPLKNTQ